ncbi:MAG: hypothetical protein KBC17_04100 [Candidatus Pacebacteria bacterium]|nr:hypothetical protein [Candidatus Paceibacterota bacterium]
MDPVEDINKIPKPPKLVDHKIPSVIYPKGMEKPVAKTVDNSTGTKPIPTPTPTIRPIPTPEPKGKIIAPAPTISTIPTPKIEGVAMNPMPPKAMENKDPEHEQHIRGLRTFSSDMATAMKDTKGSIIKIAIAEDERRREDQKEIERAPRKNLIFFLSGLLLFILAIAGIYGVFWYKEKTSVVPAVTETVIPKSIIRSEDAQTLDITSKLNEDVIPSFREIVADPKMRAGTVKNIILAKKSGADGAVSRITSNDFLKIARAHAPADFLRSLSKEFMLGIYLYNTSNPFLVIKGTAHDYLLSGMIKWEPFLVEDMAKLFNIDIAGERKIYTDTPFKDALVQNRDARVVEDANGVPVLFYSFLDPNTILIATDPKTLIEGVRRFNE